jgi:FKBP-type peptidyl-prolyl cis-trans isomerase SlyD
MTLMIGKHSVVSLNYTLKNDAGEVVDTSEGGEPLSYLHGASNLIPGLEAELEGKMTGSSFNVSIAPDQAYGEIREELIQTIDKSMFQGVESIEPGMSFMAQGDGGQQQRVVVTDVQGEQVTIDANHPMAGQNLHFEVEVVDVRDATEQEISHGHVHADGHDH